MEAILEGLLFIAGDDGLTIEKIIEITDFKKEEIDKTILNLEKEYENNNRGIKIEKLGNKIKLTTKKEHDKYYQKYFSFDNDETLSPAALEVLAIIAYNKEVTRNMVDEIRGVSSSHLIRKLLSKNLIKIKGKSELPGKPNLYGVTDYFLDYFGINSLEELPEVVNPEKLEELDLYESIYNDEKN